ncbi:MAG: quinoprotein glucose dehydrogenase [Rhodothermales bacterium]|jgi:quinoprotein glucose dehydrogenase
MPYSQTRSTLWILPVLASLYALADPLVPSDWNSSVKRPADMRIHAFAETDVKNVTALTVDAHGRVFVAETHRWRKQIHDNRNVPIKDFRSSHGEWLMDDLACRTTNQRHDMLQRWADGGRFKEYADFSHFRADTEIVRMLEDRDGDGKADRSSVFADSFNSPVSGTAAGIMAWGDEVFFANIPHIWRLQDADNDGKAERVESIQEGFGVRTSISGHDLNGFVVGTDRRIYWTVGDRGYDLKTKEGRHYQGAGKGAVFRCEMDGSQVHRYCDGLRNPKEIVIDNDGNFFTVDNNADIGDKARVYYLLPGADYGWRMGHQVAGQSEWAFGKDSTETPSPWMEEGIWERPFDCQPRYVTPPVSYITSGPSGFAFDPGLTSLPSAYDGDFYICDYRGSAARSGLFAFKLKPQGAGFQMHENRVIIEGIALTDIEFGYDGKLYMSDFIGGWTMPDDGKVLTASGVENKFFLWRLKRLARKPFATLESSQLADLLDHPDRRIRLRAQFALSDRADAHLRFAEIANDSKAAEFARLHAVWGLGYLGRTGKDVASILNALLAEPSLRVRAQVLHVLGEVPGADLAAIRQQLAHEDRAIRSCAAIAIGHHGDPAALPALITVLNEAGDDFSLRHAGTFALQRCASEAEIAEFANRPSVDLRLAAIVALRHLRSPALAAFTADEEPLVLREVARAIYDENITDAYSELAGHIGNLMPFDGQLPRYRGNGLDHEERIRRLDRQFHRRVIYANWHLGTAESANALLAYAENKDMPVLMRLEALQCIATWKQPHALDRVVGDLRPIAERELPEITDALDPIVRAGNGPVLAAAVALAPGAGYEVPLGRLHSIVMTPNMGGEARAAALKSWLAGEPENPDITLFTMLADPEDDVFLTALNALVTRNPQLAGDIIRLVAYSGKANRQRRQKTVEALAELLPEARNPILVKALKQLGKDQLPKLIRLEAVDAASAAAPEAEEISLLLEEWKESVKEEPLAEYAVALEGGDAKRGEEIVKHHAAAQCLRCHGYYGGGGNAGPDFGGIGARESREYLLESIINPGAKVAKGWGIVSLALHDGSTVSGTLSKEDAETFTVKVGEEEMAVKRSEVREQVGPISAMPPMAAVLSKAEIRDIVAYLAEQKKPYNPPKPKDH